MPLTEGARYPELIADPALVARARTGDADAFGELVAPRLDRILRTARAILRNESDARDATQDAFLSAWVNLPRLRDEDRFDAWLHRVLLNRCRDLLRRRQRSREIALEGTEILDAPPDATGTNVMAAFDRLPLAYRQILALHHVEDRPVTELSRLLGIPEGTVKSRLYAARRALERALEDRA
jgi:RNA polymerase sigma-70 factor, ECF subfamily